MLAGVSDEIAALAAEPEAPDYAARIDALAAIPEQIVRFLAERLEHGVPEREPMLEVLVKRHYRDHELHALSTAIEEGRPFAVADYTLEGRRTHLVSTIGLVSELVDGSALVRGVTGEVAARPIGYDSVVDLYLSWPDAAGVVRAGLRGARRPARAARLRPAGPPGRGRRVRRWGPSRPLLHLPPCRGRHGRGHPRPRHAPHGRATAQPLAAARLRRHQARGARGRAALPLRRHGQRGRPAPRRARAGAPARRRPRRDGPGHRPAPRRARDRQLPRGDPPCPGAPAAPPASDST